MYYFVNNGNLVNRAMNQFVCSSKDELQQIPKKDIIFGSTALVLDENKVYVADSNKQWVAR